MDFRDDMSRSTPSDNPSLRDVEKEVRNPPTVSLVAREPSEIAIEVPSINLPEVVVVVVVCFNVYSS